MDQPSDLAALRLRDITPLPDLLHGSSRAGPARGRVWYHPYGSIGNRAGPGSAVSAYPAERFLVDLALERGWSSGLLPARKGYAPAGRSPW